MANRPLVKKNRRPVAHPSGWDEKRKTEPRRSGSGVKRKLDVETRHNYINLRATRVGAEHIICHVHVLHIECHILRVDSAVAIDVTGV